MYLFKIHFGKIPYDEIYISSKTFITGCNCHLNEIKIGRINLNTFLYSLFFHYFVLIPD